MFIFNSEKKIYQYKDNYLAEYTDQQSEHIQTLNPTQINSIADTIINFIDMGLEIYAEDMNQLKNILINMA